MIDGYHHTFGLVQCDFILKRHVLSDIDPSNEIIICVPVDGVSDTRLLDHGTLLGVSNVIHRPMIISLNFDDVHLMLLVVYLAQLITLTFVEDGSVQL